MSNLIWGVQDNTLMDHLEHVQNMVDQGWAVVNSCTMFDHNNMERVYTTFLRKDNTPAPKNGVYMASLMEVLEKRVAEVVERLEVLEATADDDGQPEDLAAPTDWVVKQLGQQLIPVEAIWYREAVEEALAEDEQAGGNHG